MNNDFFEDINFKNIVSNIKDLYSSDGSMSILLDFERCLDESDLYAYKNWELGQLVQGPVIKKYTVRCIFMWPYHLMPDPRGGKRLSIFGCKVKCKKTHIKVPVQVDSPDDFVDGTKYPKMKKKHVWLFSIEIPKDLIGDIREGSIDLAGKTIDLGDLDDSYDKDLDTESMDENDNDKLTSGMDDMGSGMPPPSGPPGGMGMGGGL